MNNFNKERLKRIFFKSGCKVLTFKGCQWWHNRFKKIVNKPGCTSCARRRAKRKIGNQILNIVKDKKFSEVYRKN